MENFAKYILDEKDMLSKMEIAYFLSKKGKISFDSSIVFKAEIARLFLETTNLNLSVDNNEMITAVLLCNCKKVESAQDLDRIHSYAKLGADFLATLGFDFKFCKMCEEVNRYSGSEPRELESDILEVVDQFGGMLLNRPERAGFSPDEALILLKERNLKNKNNKFLDVFTNFVIELEKLEIVDRIGVSPLKKLVKIYNENETVVRFMKEVVGWYTPRINELLSKETAEEKNENEEEILVEFDEKRSFFTEETTKKFMGKIQDNIVEDI